MSKFKKEYQENALDEIKQIALKVLESDENRNKLLERKAEVLLGFLGIIIPIFIGLFQYFYSKNNFILDLFFLFKIILTIKTLFFVFLTLICFVASAIFCILTITTRTFKNIDLVKIWETEERGNNITPLIQIKKDLIDHFYLIHKFNKNVLDKKANVLSFAFFSLIPGLILIIIVFIILVFLY